MLRVIAGEFRGMRLAAPEQGQTRPMTDRVKETLFNILGARYAIPGGLPEFDVMDVFAGTGALGIEALSRGARGCVFIERDRRVLPTLRSNVGRIANRARVLIRSDNAWTMRYETAGIPPIRGPAPATGGDPPAEPLGAAGFGLIFMDPPYADTRDELRIVDMMDRAAAALTPEGVIIFRFPGKTDLWDLRYAALECVDRRDFSNMRIALLARRG
ncbi:MAG: RsmD family RNA methyltransferase [Phycisphaerales bacterium]|nr:RsmD family RNA methyltransferase [Phycisphaerales bacterium]